MDGAPGGAGLADRGLRGRDTGAQHDEIGGEQRLGPMPAKFEMDAGVAHLGILGDGVAPVGQRDGRAAAHEQLGRRDAAAGGADDHHPLAGNGARRIRGHRSFNVVRLNRAKMIARMTNRAMTFGSLQPMSSKWWCSGAIRKTRLPVSLNEATWITTDAASMTKTPPTITKTNSCLMIVGGVFVIEIGRAHV